MDKETALEFFGRIGGSNKSEKKRRSSRVNGLSGGRPHKEIIELDPLPTTQEIKAFLRRVNPLAKPDAPIERSGEYAVYCLLENEKRVRYIGITKQRLKTRLYQHLSDFRKNKNIHKYNWIRKCEADNIAITIHPIKSGVSEKLAQYLEQMLIAMLKKPFMLTNTHAGGSTGYAGLSEESKAKHRASMQKLQES